MPEGHTVHRTAKRLQRELAGTAVTVSSPQGRFTDAKIVSGQRLKLAEAWGKQLFLHFETAAIRIHLGIYGKWGFQRFEAAAPEPVGAVRARFLSGDFLADLRGPTACELVDREEIAAITANLGPDPLRKDHGDGEKFFERVTKSKRPIGQLLMDQSVLAGVGNVYRAEILFRNAQNPHTPGAKTDPAILQRIWDDAVKLMPIGVRTGLMLTREGFLTGRPRLDQRYYVYKREGQPCRQCGTEVSLELMATRKLYWCTKCQA